MARVDQLILPPTTGKYVRQKVDHRSGKPHHKEGIPVRVFLRPELNVRQRVRFLFPRPSPVVLGPQHLTPLP